jgi:hypothetical protein
MTTYKHWNVQPVFYETAWLRLWWPQDVIRTTGILSHSYKFGYIVRSCETTILYQKLYTATAYRNTKSKCTDEKIFLDKLLCMTSFLTCVYGHQVFLEKLYCSCARDVVKHLASRSPFVRQNHRLVFLVHWLVNFALGVAPWLTLVQHSLAMKTDNFWRA